jgi:hypothetical protein
MTGALADLWSEYHALNQLWDGDDQDDPDSITLRQTKIAAQMAAIEARTLGEVTMQAKVHANTMGVDPVHPERALAVAIGDRLEAMAQQPTAPRNGPIVRCYRGRLRPPLIAWECTSRWRALLRVRDQRRPNSRLTANPVANAMAALRSGRVLTLLTRLPKSFRRVSRSERSERRFLAGACLNSADLRFSDSRFRSRLDPVPSPDDRRARGGARPFTSRPLLDDAARARAMLASIARPLRRCPASCGLQGSSFEQARLGYRQGSSFHHRPITEVTARVLVHRWCRPGRSPRSTSLRIHQQNAAHLEHGTRVSLHGVLRARDQLRFQPPIRALW